MAVPIPSKKRANDISACLQVFDGAAANQEHVQIAVAIEVQKGCASTHRLDDVLFGQASLNILEGANPRFAGNVNEYRMIRSGDKRHPEQGDKDDSYKEDVSNVDSHGFRSLVLP